MGSWMDFIHFELILNATQFYVHRLEINNEKFKKTLINIIIGTGSRAEQSEYLRRAAQGMVRQTYTPDR